MCSATISITLDPPLSKWEELLSERSPEAADPALRRTVLEAASRFTESLPIGSASMGVGTEVSNLTRIAASGHQAVIYHPGILFKNHCLDELSAGGNAVCLNVIVDTDAADCGTVRFPVAGPGGPRLHSERIAEGPDVSFEQSLLPRDRLSGVFTRIVSALAELGQTRAAGNASGAKALYEQVAGAPAVIGNTAVRRAITGARHLELPVSALIRLHPVSRVLAGWIADWDRFSRTYNATLRDIRSERGIRSRANPFPDLETDERGAELPFWTIRDAKRERLFVKEKNGKLSIERVGEAADVEALAALIAEGETLVAPRAVPISTLLRCYVSDLFVHGLGGARYDRFTDLFVERYLGAAPPPFAVASATVRLFEEDVRRYEKEHIDSDTFRKIVYHLERHKDRPEIAAMPGLDAIIAEQKRRIAEIKELKARGQPCGSETRRLKQHMLRAGASVKEALSGRTVGGSTDPNYLTAIYSRELPFFFFDPGMFRGVTSATDK